MAYVDYNLELYRQGYRPYGETDPFAASMLNGMTTRMGPFGPWMLRGGELGQVQPFTRSGGWRLHGLGQAPIPDGSVAIYQGQWTSTYTKGMTDVISQVSAAINADGELAVRQASTDAGLLSKIAQATVVVGPLLPGPFNVALKLQVTNGVGFGSPADIASIVNHFVYVVTGQMPISGSVPSVQPPGASTPAPTGQPVVFDPTTGLPAGIPQDGSQQTEDFQTWMSNNWPWIAAGVGLLIGVPFVLNRL